MAGRPKRRARMNARQNPSGWVAGEVWYYTEYGTHDSDDPLRLNVILSGGSTRRPGAKAYWTAEGTITRDMGRKWAVREGYTDQHFVIFQGREDFLGVTLAEAKREAVAWIQEVKALKQ
jgi:hypothetical protein